MEQGPRGSVQFTKTTSTTMGRRVPPILRTESTPPSMHNGDHLEFEPGADSDNTEVKVPVFRSPSDNYANDLNGTGDGDTDQCVEEETSEPNLSGG